MRQKSCQSAAIPLTTSTTELTASTLPWRRHRGRSSLLPSRRSRSRQWAFPRAKTARPSTGVSATRSAQCGVARCQRPCLIRSACATQVIVGDREVGLGAAVCVHRGLASSWRRSATRQTQSSGRLRVDAPCRHIPCRTDGDVAAAGFPASDTKS